MLWCALGQIFLGLSQHLFKPLETHCVALKHLLRYLQGTLDYELCYRKNDDGLLLIGYSDADWASNVNDRRSITGYCSSLCKTGPPISWKSRKTTYCCIVNVWGWVLYIALAACVQEGMFLCQFLNHVDMESKFEPVIFEDNQGAIALSKNVAIHQRSKYIDIRYHFIHTQLNNGTIVLKYCPMQRWLLMWWQNLRLPGKTKLEKFFSFLFG